jgi:hypothetical protein
MSDEVGTHVRGEGVASVVGLGVSVVNIAPTLVAIDGNSFNASSEIFNALATGASQTNANVSLQIDVGEVTASISVISATSGSAYAFAR